MSHGPTPLRGPIFVSEYSFIYKAAVLLSVAGVCVAGISFASPNPSDAQPANATTRHVLAAGVIPDGAAEEWLTGVIQSAQPMEAAATTGGRVLRVLVNVGDQVTAGQPVAILDTTAARLRAGQASAEAERARAAAAERANAARRAQGLAETGAMAPAERDAALAEAAAARAGLAGAEAAAKAAAHEAGQGVIRAPAAGIVAERLAAVGSVLTPGQKIVTLEGTGEKVIYAAAPQRLAPRMRPGQSVRYISEGLHGTGEIIGISPRVADGGVVPVRIRITSGSPQPGGVVQVSVSAAAETGVPTLRIPASALLLDQSRQHYVYRIGQRAKVERVAVRVIGFAGNDARVSGPLHTGETVIAAGGAFVSPGQTVAVAKPGI